MFLYKEIWDQFLLSKPYKNKRELSIQFLAEEWCLFPNFVQEVAVTE